MWANCETVFTALLTVNVKLHGLGGAVTLHVAGPARVGPRVSLQDVLKHETVWRHQDAAITVLTDVLTLSGKRGGTRG